MATIITDLKNNFRRGNIHIRLIYINVAIFVVVALTGIVLRLFNIPSANLIQCFEMPASLPNFAVQPWAILTYMFLHADLLHILFNMLWLFWFGDLFWPSTCGDCISWAASAVDCSTCWPTTSSPISVRWPTILSCWVLRHPCWPSWRLRLTANPIIPSACYSWAVSGIHNKRLLQCTGQTLLHHTDPDRHCDRINQDVQSPGYALHNAAGSAGQHPYSPDRILCSPIPHLLCSTRRNLHHGASVQSAAAGAGTMNFPPPVTDLPRVRCCNCQQWVSLYPTIFGFCRTSNAVKYQNGACSQWIWNAANV